MLLGIPLGVPLGFSLGGTFWRSKGSQERPYASPDSLHSEPLENLQNQLSRRSNTI
jgi:hypothetical protein